jgi:hypothetical protein
MKLDRYIYLTRIKSKGSSYFTCKNLRHNKRALPTGTIGRKNYQNFGKMVAFATFMLLGKSLV